MKQLLSTATAASEFLGTTRYIDHGDPAIRNVARLLERRTMRETAVRMHDFVRDEIRFGWTRRFYAMKASDVLAARVGYCNTKATLFIALLRAAGIPARQRFVDIRADILTPFVSLPQRYVDHSYTEVWLDGRWLAVDSYIPDPALFARARSMLATRGRDVGWGVHVDGVNAWDGRRDAFSQWVHEGCVSDLGTRDYGIFADTAAFYDAARRAEALAGVQQFLIPMLIGFADHRVVRFLRDAPQP